MNAKDDPVLLLSKPSYKHIVLKMKAPLLNNIFAACCYSSENDYKIYKWIPNDPKWDVTNGKSGKRIMKIKEKSSLLMRCVAPVSCRGYEANFIAENTRKFFFSMSRPFKPTILCF